MAFVYVPKKVYIGAVSAEGATDLNAFDNCLIKLGIGNVSLVKVTSILPEEVEFLDDVPRLPYGANVPCVYTYIISDKPGEKIAAAIAIAKTKGGPTLVAEFSAKEMSSEKAEEEAKRRVLEMAKARNLDIEWVESYSVDHTVERIGCALAIVVEVE